MARLVVLMAAVYVGYAPLALWLHADFLAHQRIPPKGALVRLGYLKRVANTDLTDDDRKRGPYYMAVFRWIEDEPTKPYDDGVADPAIVLLENDVVLGSPCIFYLAYSKSYTFAFHTSDNSDPSLNGREYWIARRQD